MQTMDAHWEDEENNRRVGYSVDYTREGAAIEITAVTPKYVAFMCPESKSAVRKIGVWTTTGRQLLAHQLRTSGHVTEIERQLETGLAV